MIVIIIYFAIYILNCDLYFSLRFSGYHPHLQSSGLVVQYFSSLFYRINTSAFTITDFQKMCNFPYYRWQIKYMHTYLNFSLFFLPFNTCKIINVNGKTLKKIISININFYKKNLKIRGYVSFSLLLYIFIQRRSQKNLSKNKKDS